MSVCILIKFRKLFKKNYDNDFVTTNFVWCYLLHSPIQQFENKFNLI